MGKDSYGAVEAVARCARRPVYVAGNAQLDAKDQYNLSFVFSCSACLLMDLLPHCDSGLRRFSGFLGGSQQIDVLRVAQSIKAGKGLLLEQSQTSPLCSGVFAQGFKHLAADRRYYATFFTAVETLVLAWSDTPSPTTFSALFQWFTFLENVNVRSLDLSIANQSSYREDELAMASWDYCFEDLDCLASILSEWTEGYAFDSLYLSHGPGAVSGLTGRLGSRVKFSLMATDWRLSYMLERIAPQDLPLFPSAPTEWLDRTNDIVFVPKKMDKNRVISKEPATLGYFQHGVDGSLRRCINTCKALQGRINFSNQAVSRDMAWEGSLFGKYATLDLSKASDSVSLALVKSVIRNPALRRDLLCTRSDFARLPDGSRVHLAKFAPMGSATCFPLETLIFAGCCEAAVRGTLGRASTENDFCVFGDDIVIRSDVVGSLENLLARLHFSVNRDKSFSTIAELNFREACGGYFINGNDVTPLRLSRQIGLFDPSEQCRAAGVRSTLVSLANECYLRGMSNLRKRVLCEIKTRYPRFKGIPFSSNFDNDGIHLLTDPDSCTNWNLSWKADLGPGSPYYGHACARVFSDVCHPNKDLLREYSTVFSDENSRLYLYFQEKVRQTLWVSPTAEAEEYFPIDDLPQRTDEVRKWAYID